ncbi:MAG: 50S ribosomal protein L10 [Bacilli bacterium]|nr:50S ribosomal protein L10 [Bacilli bacterium]
MASQKVLAQKTDTVNEIIDNIKNSESVIIFTYQGLTVDDISDLRKKLRDANGKVKVYKNTLVKRAMDELNYNVDEFLEGPNAMLFGKDLLEPIKVLADYQKEHELLNIRVGVISGDVASLDVIKEYASIPSRDGLLTMFAAGLMQYAKEFAIGVNLYAEGLESK